MPLIDVYAPAGLFPPDTERPLAEQLTAALLRAEGVRRRGIRAPVRVAGAHGACRRQTWRPDVHSGLSIVDSPLWTERQGSTGFQPSRPARYFCAV
jgi:hypothetical protein